MAIAVREVRTDAMNRRRERLGGFHPANACELCLKPIKADSRMVMIDHERYEFVTVEEAAYRGAAVSGFSVGPDCEKRIRGALLTNRAKALLMEDDV